VCFDETSCEECGGLLDCCGVEVAGLCVMWRIDRVGVRVSEARSLVYLHRCFQE
jgi:hypothetical protein